MKEKIITETRIEGNIIFDRKVIFENDCIVTGKIQAGDISSDGDINSDGHISSDGHINSDGDISSDGHINSDGYISSDGDINSGGYISSDGDINSGGDIRSDGDINSGGDISSAGDISFSYHIYFKKITCKLLRISPDCQIERSYWIEKMMLFGFCDVSKAIEDGCSDEIREKLSKIPETKKVLACKYWTKIERLVIKSWIDGQLVNEKL